ncbi:ferredoxin--NADP reductase [Limnobacter parvus]|uniref:ferredoxin--NADP(+) reductase n=1 Tax=Limnobacter parvus TaxID=2939690 RepID=A0ABT1XFH3_9BURK|nr:ferredoxin--NADP reductase [Limnobacter parvus]MCR2746030.1 ferredoxin--NADP reductase [Limnobacter parvus]
MSEVEDKYTRETITSLKVWVPGKLFSFTCTRPSGFRFTAGQFARLGVDNTLNLPGEPEIIWRAYSMVSGPYDEHLEFFSIVVPDGAFTSHLSQLEVGSPIYIDKTNFGFLTTARFESGNDLWLLGSGTGLAPFLSILHDPQTWEQFENIVLVHSARTAEELVYQDMINGFTEHPVLSELIDDVKKRFFYVPVVTREKIHGHLSERITMLLENGQLSEHTGLHLSTDRSRFMICGNPEMVTDIRKVLKSQGYSPARRNSPGEIAVENYW